MTGLRHIAMLVVLMPGAAAALTPAAPCLVDTATQQILMPMDHARAAGDLVDTFPAPRPNGFVDWEWIDGASHHLVLQHCASDKFLLWTAPEAVAEAVEDRYVAMVESYDRYTLRQLSEALTALGAAVRTGQGDIGRCGCVVNGLG